MKKLFLLLPLAMAVTTQAADKRELYDIMNRIDSELRYYDQTPEQLSAAKASLEEALGALRNSGGGPSQACVDFAYGVYTGDGYSSSYALEQAGSFCRGIAEKKAELNIVKFCYEKYREDGYAGAYSLEQAGSLAFGLRAGQLGCIRTAYDRYKNDGYSGSYSIEHAVDFCRAN